MVSIQFEVVVKGKYAVSHCIESVKEGVGGRNEGRWGGMDGEEGQCVHVRVNMHVTISFIWGTTFCYPGLIIQAS